MMGKTSSNSHPDKSGSGSERTVPSLVHIFFVLLLEIPMNFNGEMP